MTESAPGTRFASPEFIFDDPASLPASLSKQAYPTDFNILTARTYNNKGWYLTYGGTFTRDPGYAAYLRSEAVRRRIAQGGPGGVGNQPIFFGWTFHEAAQFLPGCRRGIKDHYKRAYRDGPWIQRKTLWFVVQGGDVYTDSREAFAAWERQGKPDACIAVAPSFEEAIKRALLLLG
ncbi:hypothetical protein K438DRAFT_1976700 [Mycena galopus ATCC 62051]|nr:hypothetical protein K438DRAFT_1976700 [Mycena galopus ATCC 62051]